MCPIFCAVVPDEAKLGLSFLRFWGFPRRKFRQMVSICLQILLYT